MFEKITNFFKGLTKKEKIEGNMAASKNTARERLHLVLMQDRANVSADFLELMKQEIIEVIKKYIEVDEGAIDVRLTNKPNDDGTTGAPALYANIPIMNIKHEMGKDTDKDEQEEAKQEEKNEEIVEENAETENIEAEQTEEQQTSENNEEQQEKNEEVKSEKEEKEKATVVDNTVNN